MGEERSDTCHVHSRKGDREASALNTPIQEVRDYWDSRPCNVRHSSAPLGSRQYFDEVEQRKYLVEPHIPKFAEFDRWSGRKVLEVGCGIGTDAVKFARAGSIYTGIELSQISMDMAQERFRLYGLQGAFLQANAEELDSLGLPEESFDLIYSFGVLHHTPNHHRALDQISRLVKIGGTVKVMVYAENSWKAAMIRHGLDQPEAQYGCPIAKTFTKETVLEWFSASSLHVQEMQQDHIFPYVIEKYVNYEYEVQPWFKAMPEKLFEALEKELGWHLMITATRS